MAYRRSITVTVRSNLIPRRINPSIGCVLRGGDDDDCERHSPSSVDSSQQRTSVLLQRRLFGGGSVNASVGFGGDKYCVPYSIPSRMGLGFNNRHMSTSVGESSDKIEVISDVVGAFADSTMETVSAHAPVMSEIAIATADSWYPVAALQYVIDGVHCFTGLDWWASIALTTFLIRGATIPFLIHQLKASTKLAMLRPRLEELQQEMTVHEAFEKD